LPCFTKPVIIYVPAAGWLRAMSWGANARRIAGR
jgi:hypothetical protein